MRFLNKIIFINSGSVRYAEIEMDGNVHFIGTQGVGKSSLLRAILFFYNADKTKLGIPREKKRFDEYYFEFQNSYIVYEVMKDGVPYCVLAYKQNGRVAYRFFDSAYKKELFIDPQGRAFESWEQIRKGLGKEIYYTKLVVNYDEFRKIIYGDNKSLDPEFRKYAILESKQFQNIPRTIQNALLNTRLEAQFIRETIIKSLNEEEIKIDLSNYSKSHLRDFENEINNIRIWFTENSMGKIAIKKQAETVIENYRILNFLKHDKEELAKCLGHRMNFISNQRPLVSSNLQAEQFVLDNLSNESDKLKGLHDKRELNISTEINMLKKEIAKAIQKEKDYHKQNIYSVIERVQEKKNLENKKYNLYEEKNLLTAKFTELSQKYDSLLMQLKNQETEFVNQREADKNNVSSEFSAQKEKLHDEFQMLVKQIDKDNIERLERAQNKVESLTDETNKLKLQGEGLKHTIYYKDEIDHNTKDISDIERQKNKLKSIAFESKKEIESLKKEWGFEEKEIFRQYENDNASLTAKRTVHADEVKKIEDKIQKHAKSLYGWLNDNSPNWEDTIGKVVDEDLVLFNEDLQPKLSDKDNTSLFGLDINLSAIPKRVKTIDEYNFDVKLLKSKIEECDKGFVNLIDDRDKGIKNLGLKFRKKINPLKDVISKMEYQFDQAELQLKKLKIDLDEFIQKAVAEKKNALNELEEQLNTVANKKSIARDELSAIRESVKRQIKLKENERNRRISDERKNLEIKINKIDSDISVKRDEVNQRKLEIEDQQNSEMSVKGADTKQLGIIETQLQAIEQELNYIEQHQTLFIEYQKDKREMFDKVTEWKSQQISMDQKQEAMQENHRKEKDRLQLKIDYQFSQVKSLREELKVFELDLKTYEEFEKSSVFEKILHILDDIKEASVKVESAVKTIAQLNDNHYNYMGRFDELRKSITVFVSNFSENNLFRFKTKFIEDEEYLSFAVDLKEFVDEDKISQFEKRVNERFSHIIQMIGKETNELISKEAEIEKVILKINNDFRTKNFVGAIRSMEMRTQSSSNKIVKLLLEIKSFNDENTFGIGTANLFSSTDRDTKNEKAVELLKQLVKELEHYKSEFLTLSESFDLQFRIIENDNDSGWVEKLSNVGSEGTDILVKAMINILLLNVFKESASKKFKDFKLHCMMDEIGRLHPNNVKGILKFANDRNILLINGSPTSYNATDYRYTYLLSISEDGANSKKHITRISRLVKATKQQIN